MSTRLLVCRRDDCLNNEWKQTVNLRRAAWSCWKSYLKGGYIKIGYSQQFLWFNMCIVSIDVSSTLVIYFVKCNIFTIVVHIWIIAKICDILSMMIQKTHSLAIIFCLQRLMWTLMSTLHNSYKLYERKCCWYSLQYCALISLK